MVDLQETIYNVVYDITKDQFDDPDFGTFFGPIEFKQKMSDALKKSYGIKLSQTIKNSPAFTKYSSFLFKPINLALRKGIISVSLDEIVREMIEDLDETTSLPPNLILFRGVGEFPDFHIGDIITDQGFMSKTSNPVSAFPFAKKILFFLHYPVETKQISISAFSRFPNEEEVLTYPGESFQIKAILETPHRKFVYADFIGYRTFSIFLTASLDTQFALIEEKFSLIRSIHSRDFVGIKTKNSLDLSSGGPLIFSFEGERHVLSEAQNKYNEEYLPIALIAQETYEELIHRITGNFYDEILEGIYHVRIPNYNLYNVIKRRNGITIDGKEDSFYIAFILILGLNEQIMGVEFPEITGIWEKS